MIVNDRTLSVLADLMDAVEVTDDFLSGVIGLGIGRIGDDTAADDTWLTRRMGKMSSRFGFGTRSVAQSYATQWGPTQLRKAAVEADRLAAQIDTARSITELGPLVAQLDELSLPTLGSELRSVAPTGPQLSAMHHRLMHAKAAMIDAKTRIVLGRRRRPGTPR